MHWIFKIKIFKTQKKEMKKALKQIQLLNKASDVWCSFSSWRANSCSKNK